MDKVTLSEAQESIIIDFIKRWGVDSPELVAELMDHYCEMVLEEMVKGRDFQEVVNSWKTKKTMLSLRAIEKSYAKQLSKNWKRDSKITTKEVLLGKPILIIVPLYLLLVIGFQMDGIAKWIMVVFCLKSVVGMGLLSWFVLWNKNRMRIYGFKRLGAYVVININLLVQTLPGLFDSSKWMNHIGENKAYVIALIVLATIVADIVYYRLYQKADIESQHLSNEILKEFKLPPRV